MAPNTLMSDSGYSLVSVMVATSLVSITIAASLASSQNAQKSQKSVEEALDLDSRFSSLRLAFENTRTCRAALLDSSGQKLRFFAGAPSVSAGEVRLGASALIRSGADAIPGLRIERIILATVGITPDSVTLDGNVYERLYVRLGIDAVRHLKTAYGSPTLSRLLHLAVLVNPATREIETCYLQPELSANGAGGGIPQYFVVEAGQIKDFVVPAGVTRLHFQAWDPGRPGSNSGPGYDCVPGNGGAGGAYAEWIQDFLPGQTVHLVAGDQNIISFNTATNVAGYWPGDTSNPPGTVLIHQASAPAVGAMGGGSFGTTGGSLGPGAGGNGGTGCPMGSGNLGAGGKIVVSY